MQKKFPALLFFLGLTIITHAQYSRFIIRFKDKGSNPFSLANPSQYLSQRSLERRTRYNIGIDSTDLPVTPGYIDSIRLSGNVIILNVSKWLNQVAVQTTDSLALVKINSLPFVLSAAPLAAKSTSAPANKKMDQSPGKAVEHKSSIFFDNAPGKHIGKSDQLYFSAGNPQPEDFDIISKQSSYNTARTETITGPPAIIENNQLTTGFYNYGQAEKQVKILNGDFLHNHGFRGEGMQLAMLDAGFYHYLTLPTFDSIRANNQVLGTWDFVANEESVNEDNYHGMQCLSTIAANLPGDFIGTAPKTSFYLYRTEDVSSEYPIEEQNWTAGMERADSLGVDITSTSLGYFDFDGTDFDYTYNDLNGNTTISARAADLAAKKGILLVVAAGNEGNSSWHYLITPSDADSVLSVGAVDTAGMVGNFSSYGPSSDGQVKPAVAAVGVNAVVANVSNGLPGHGSGTSFACPNMAGVTTCLWQAFPEINNMGIIAALETSATISSSPNDRIGYGIPDAKKAFCILLKKLYSRQSSFIACRAGLNFSLKTDNTMTVEVERKMPAETEFNVVSSLENAESFGLHNFSFTDDLNNFPAGNILYRLKVNIATDTSFYLDTIAISYIQSCRPPDENVITFLPNPVVNNLLVTIARIKDSKINIVLRNAAGQTVYRSGFQQRAGVQAISVPMTNMSRGAYFVSVYADNKKQITKEILKQ